MSVMENLAEGFNLRMERIKLLQSEDTWLGIENSPERIRFFNFPTVSARNGIVPKSDQLNNWGKQALQQVHQP